VNFGPFFSGTVATLCVLIAVTGVWLLRAPGKLVRALLAPAGLETIAERHEAIRELRPQLDLREDLELLGVEVRQGIDPLIPKHLLQENRQARDRALAHGR